MSALKHRFLSCLCPLLLAPLASPAGAEPPRYLTVYGAIYSPERMIDILRLQGRETDSSNYLVAAALAQEIGATGEYLRWEIEGQLVQHFGVQGHQEVNAVLIARWTRFPWDRWLDTGFAFGSGLSYATRVPELEPRSNEDDEESARLLKYLLVEIEAELPNAPQWSLVARLHHRSGVYGLFDGVDGGSNFIGVGLRYQF